MQLDVRGHPITAGRQANGQTEIALVGVKPGSHEVRPAGHIQIAGEQECQQHVVTRRREQVLHLGKFLDGLQVHP
jgi:hypothetical protein